MSACLFVCLLFLRALSLLSTLWFVSRLLNVLRSTVKLVRFLPVLSISADELIKQQEQYDLDANNENNKYKSLKNVFD